MTAPQSALLLLDAELRHFVQRGWKVSVITGAGSSLDDFRLAHPLIDIHVLDALTRRMDIKSDVRAMGQLVKSLRALRPDVLHTHMPKTGWLGRIGGRVAGVPHVVNTCHGLYARQPDRWASKGIALMLEWLSEGFADVNLFQNMDDSRTMHALAPWRNHIHIGNGIDLARFGSKSMSQAEARLSLGLPSSGVIVGAVGRLIRHKGVGEFTQLAQELSGEATFVWVGPQEREKATGVPLPTAPVIYLGERRDMATVYAALDIFVLPSYAEGVPRSAMEAGAMGLPLVLSDIPGSRDLGRDRDELILVPPRDVDALVEAVRQLVADAKERNRLGEAVQKRIHTERDQYVIADRLEQIHYRPGARRKAKCARLLQLDRLCK